MDWAAIFPINFLLPTANKPRLGPGCAVADSVASLFPMFAGVRGAAHDIIVCCVVDDASVAQYGRRHQASCDDNNDLLAPF